MLMCRKSSRKMIGCASLLGCAAVLQGFTVSQADSRFMKMAAEANMTEAHLGQMAEAQARPAGASHEATGRLAQRLLSPALNTSHRSRVPICLMRTPARTLMKQPRAASATERSA